MSTTAVKVIDSEESRRREEERRKRPDVQHYKPGAFSSRRPDPEDWREAARAAESEVAARRTEAGETGSATGSRGGVRRGGQARRGAKATTPVEERELEYGDKRNKKPEIEHYVPVPKKMQEKSEVEDSGRPPDSLGQREEKGQTTAKRNKKKKGKHRTNADGPALADVESSEAPAGPAAAAKHSQPGGGEKKSLEYDKRREERPNDDISGRRQQQQKGAKSRQETTGPVKDKETARLPVQLQRKEKGSKAAADLAATGQGTNKGDTATNRCRSEEQDGIEAGSRRQTQGGQLNEQPFGRNSEVKARGAAVKEGTKNDRHQQKTESYSKGVKKSKSDYWDQRGQGSEHMNQKHGDVGGQDSRQNRNGLDRRLVDGSRTWSSRGDRRRGDQARWSCHSSPSRSSRGNSPNSRTYNRQMTDPISPSMDFSGPQVSRVFRRPRTPPSQRSTVSRTPSPSLRGGGAYSSLGPDRYSDNGRGNSSRPAILRSTRDDGGQRNSFRGARDRNNVKDSRDLEGWSRGEQKRYDEGLWDPQGKPPSGRVKSATPARSNLPPRFQRRAGEEPARRLDSENSVVSDWSLEVEEEEERRSLDGASPVRLDEGGQAQHFPAFPVAAPPSGPGIIRLVADPTPMPHPAWRSMGPEAWRQPVDGYHSHHHSLPAAGQRHLFDPSGPVRPVRLEWSERQSSPDYPGHPFPNVRIPMATSRFAPPSHLLPTNVAAGPGYRPPFPQARLFTPQPRPRFMFPTSAPDWYNVLNESIYGNRKVDINCIVSIVRGDNQLCHFMQGGLAVLCSRWDKEVREARHQIMAAARHLLEKDIFFLAEKEVDLHIWRIVYYQLIEILKSAYLDTENTSPETRQILKSQLLLLFEEGADYYSQLLADLTKVYNLDLERFYDALEPRELSRCGRVALIAAQKYLLCLGDLARYKEQVSGTSNYGRARHFYQKANNLDMRNGRPFNMLAILAKLSNRKFEAVYYHIRCLTSRNPIPASKEGLIIIFEEMKRRWEAGEKQKLDLKAEAERGSRLIRGSRVRREIWIRGDGGRRLHRTTSASGTRGEPEDQDLLTLSVADLNKKFINTFLHLHGMLFTQINTDDFQLAAQSLLDQFRVLIAKSPLPLSADRLVQIMALNMYSIEETKLRAVTATANYRSVMQTRALELAGDLFSILVERCNLLVAASGPSEILVPDSPQQEELTPLLAAIKVWCDWLIGNNDTWYPVVSAEPFTQLAQLATRLEVLKPAVSGLLESCLSDEAWRALPQARREEFDLIKLPEDTLLCDFEPWFRGLDWATYRQFYPREAGILAATAENAKRIDQIRMCVEVLEGLEPPVLKWSVLDRSHVCLLNDRDESTQESVARDIAEAKLTALIARDEDILEESYSGDEEESSERRRSVPPLAAADKEPDDVGPLSEELVRLRLRREELVKQEEARQAQRDLLAQHVSTTLEVRPKLVVPDTNAFVDHLEDIKKIALSGEFQVRIPVIVMGELEGLSKMRDHEANSAEHAATVREASRAAIAWIREKQPNVKCVTTKGSILTSVGVTCEEEQGEAMKNDDKILQCCLALDTSPPPRTEGGMKTVGRNAVLLTEDRNLKLKAHIQDCAVSRLKDFMAWIALVP